MLVKKAYKFRFYPDRAQAEQLHKTFGCTRKLWNEMLAERKAVYDELKDDRETLHSHKYKTGRHDGWIDERGIPDFQVGVSSRYIFCFFLKFFSLIIYILIKLIKLI